MVDWGEDNVDFKWGFQIQPQGCKPNLRLTQLQGSLLFKLNRFLGRLFYKTEKQAQLIKK